MELKLPALIGFPDQVKWGNQIRKNIIARLQAILPRIETTDASESEKQEMRQEIESLIVDIAKQDSSTWWIRRRLTLDRDLKKINA